MDFQFEVTIKESKGAVNTAAKIANLLKGAQVTFSTLAKSSGTPGIWAVFQDQAGKRFIAVRKTTKTADFWATCKEYGEWWTAYPRDPKGHGEENFLFSHTTDAAKELIDEWIKSLCDEYDRRLDADGIQNTEK